MLKQFKKLVVALTIALSSLTVSAQLFEGQAIVAGLLGGMYIGKNLVNQPNTVSQTIQQSPNVYYTQQPIIVSPSQLPMFNPTDHGYCQIYQGEQYAFCLGNLEKIRMEAAYRRGRGY
jgi:hypothetical protein